MEGSKDVFVPIYHCCILIQQFSPLKSTASAWDKKKGALLQYKLRERNSVLSNIINKLINPVQCHVDVTAIKLISLLITVNKSEGSG